MKTIELTMGRVALVDDEDYRWLYQIPWYAAHLGNPRRSHWYAVTTDRAHRKMHRVIMNAPAGLVVDHIDGDGLNNQKENLRLATPAENAKNRRKLTTANGAEPTSRFKGVNYSPTRSQWLARIQVDRVSTHLGYFGDEVEAAVAYDLAAKRLHGRFANLNFAR